MILHNAGRGVLAATVLVFAVAAALAQVPSSPHVVLVIDENITYNDVMANTPRLTGQGHRDPSVGYIGNLRR
jgi:hypothetical protein